MEFFLVDINNLYSRDIKIKQDIKRKYKYLYELARTRLVLTSSVRPIFDKNSVDKNSSNKGTKNNRIWDQ